MGVTRYKKLLITIVTIIIVIISIVIIIIMWDRGWWCGKSGEYIDSALVVMSLPTDQEVPSSIPDYIGGFFF